MLVNGLRKPTGKGCRLAWDRLCVLHLLALAFIDDFGYRWQRPKDDDVRRAVQSITHAATLSGFEKAITAPLALARRDSLLPTPLKRQRRTPRTIRKDAE